MMDRPLSVTPSRSISRIGARGPAIYTRIGDTGQLCKVGMFHQRAMLHLYTCSGGATIVAPQLDLMIEYDIYIKDYISDVHNPVPSACPKASRTRTVVSLLDPPAFKHPSCTRMNQVSLQRPRSHMSLCNKASPVRMQMRMVCRMIFFHSPDTHKLLVHYIPFCCHLLPAVAVVNR